MVQIVMTPPKMTLSGTAVTQRTANSKMEESDIPHLAGCCRGRDIVLHETPCHPREGGDTSGRTIGLPLKHPPPLPVRLAPSRSLDLAPVATLARTVGRSKPLRHDPLELQPLGRG